jgi:pimeloyl-ACP methyl ester carboxylesterase
MTQLAPPMPEPAFADDQRDPHGLLRGRAARVGVPIVLCHGFPEFSYSWRWQIAALAAAGRWVIVPDQRGYGLTDRPEAVEDYDMAHLTGDLVGLLDHLGVEKAVFCGHDWGGMVVWQMPLMHPDRWPGWSGVNTPFLPRLPVDPIRCSATRSATTCTSSTSRSPAWPTPSWGPTSKRPCASSCASRPACRPPSPAASRAALSGPAGRPGPLRPPTIQPVPDAEELAVFVETFQRTGFTGGINWYRNFVRNWERAEHLPAPDRRHPLPDDHGRARRGAAAVPGRPHGRPDLGPGEGAGRGQRPLDPAGKARAR